MKNVAIILFCTAVLASCHAPEESPPVSEPSPSDRQAAPQSPQNDPEPEETSFDTEELGGRYTVLAETSADLGFGFASRVIGLNDEKRNRDESQRATLDHLIVETSRGQFSKLDFVTGFPTEEWYDLFLKAWQRFAATMSEVGDWYTYFGIVDYNQNGRDEIFALSLTSCCSVLRGWESDDDGMKLVIDLFDFGTRVSDVAFPGDGRIRVISEREPDRYRLFDFQWDQELSTYAHVATEETNAATFE